jgi:hypothetical protein
MDKDVKQELQNNIDQSYKTLVSETPVAKLPEKIFSQYFLPYFSGEKTPTVSQPVFAEWVSVAGNPMAPVDVIGNDNEVLFRVPALYDTGMVTMLQGKTMREIFSQYELYNNNLPQVANNFLAKALEHKSDGYTEVPLTQAQKDWEGILTRYNLGSKTESSGSVANNDDKDDLIYD